jgi:hypothetical protein
MLNDYLDHGYVKDENNDFWEDEYLYETEQIDED